MEANHILQTWNEVIRAEFALRIQCLDRDFVTAATQIFCPTVSSFSSCFVKVICYHVSLFGCQTWSETRVVLLVMTWNLISVESEEYDTERITCTLCMRESWVTLLFRKAYQDIYIRLNEFPAACHMITGSAYYASGFSLSLMHDVTAWISFHTLSVCPSSIGFWLNLDFLLVNCINRRVYTRDETRRKEKRTRHGWRITHQLETTYALLGCSEFSVQRFSLIFSLSCVPRLVMLSVPLTFSHIRVLIYWRSSPFTFAHPLHNIISADASEQGFSVPSYLLLLFLTHEIEISVWRLNQQPFTFSDRQRENHRTLSDRCVP